MIALARERQEQMTDTPTSEPDTLNRFAVGVRGDNSVIFGRDNTVLSRDEAMNLAAWLAVLADPDGDDFRALYDAVRYS